MRPDTGQDVEADPEVERWFLRRGVPMLRADADDRDPRRIWRRALPALLTLYALMLLRGVVLSEGIVADAVIGGAVLVVTWLAANAVRRRPLLSFPEGLGRFELAVFVVGPAVPALVTSEASNLILEGDSIGLRLAGAALAMLFQLTVLAVVWLMVSFGIVALAAWLLRELAETLAVTGAALARTLPLLLGVVTFFFLTAEVWQSIGLLHWFPYALLVLLFTVLGGAFIARGRTLDIERLACFATRDDLDAALVAGSFPRTAPLDGYPMTCDLDRRQRVNLVAVAVLSRLVVAVVVAVVVGLFFVVFGFLTVNADVVKAWTLQDPRTLVTLRVPTRTLILSWEHLGVAGFLATFSGFYFTIVSATDPTLRAGLRDTAEEGVRNACAARLALDRG